MSRSSRADRNLRLVTSHVHPGQPCQPCILCKKDNQSKYFHPKSWKDASLLDCLKQYEPSLDIEPQSCICRPCRNELNEVKDITNTGFVPRWRKSNKGITKSCAIPECANTAQKITKLANRSTILQLFSIENESDTDSSDEGVPLCTEHYGAWYRHSNPPHKRCKTCGKNLTDKSRPYPQPKLIQQFLQENTDFSAEINPDDRACYTCYKSHLVTIQQINSSNNSANPDLGKLLDKIKEDIQATCNIHTIESAILYTSNVTALYVGEILLKHTAILLPEVNDFFHTKLKEIIQQCNIPLNSDYSTITPTWLRSKLSTVLEPHMAYRCSIKKCGTVLYRYGGDMLHALNKALGQVRNLTQKLTSEEQFQQQLSETCLTLNSKFHASIKDMVKQDALSPHNIEDFDLDSFIRDLDPSIWKAICLLTQPPSEKAKKGTSSSHNIRKIRRCFCVCALMFSTDSRCSFPMHTLIADAVETCGGSARLKKLLNRLGVCASIDTHDRYIQYRVQKKLKEGPMANYPQRTFMLVSVDNLDYLLGFARIFCGKQQSSWHGTTIQVVQPQPLALTDTTPSDPSTTLTQCKRLHSALTPCASPAKESSLHSPVTKKQRRMRTGKENKSATHNEAITTATMMGHTADLRKPNLKLVDFKLSSIDKQSLQKIGGVFTQYMLLKFARTEHNETVTNLQSYLTIVNGLKAPECSNIIYYKILHQRCDDKETLLNSINEVYTEFIATGKKNIMFLEGDQATYERLQSIKREYGQDLSWMIPFPGDWHILKNFQEVLIKIYYDAGLRDLALASGYHPNSVCSNFKRTHNFLMEVWEALYRSFLSIFTSEKGEGEPNLLTSTAAWISSFPPSTEQASAQRNLCEMFTDLSEKSNYQDDFQEFMNTKMKENEIFKFWGQFVLQDCYAYVSLYLAVRSGNWKLRMASIKSMAALFSAFDRQKYQKLIPQHITDLLTIPKDDLSKLESGGFTVSIKGRPCHSIGVDEAHEMCINKDCKEFVTRPSAEYMNRIALFLPVRAEALKKFENEIFPDKKREPHVSTEIFCTKEPDTKKFEENVRKQVNKLTTSTLINQQNGSDLCHLFSRKNLTAEQTQDLLNFREIGQSDYDAGVEYYVIRKPSIKPPKHRKRLLTFTERRSRRKKVSAVERERKLQIECWKKRVAFSTTTGAQLQAGYEQVIELPRAIAMSNGTPIKGTKSSTTNCLEKRYQQCTPKVITSSLQPGWVPNSVIMEGMFLINIKPWIAHNNLGEYANFLLKQHIHPHYRNGSSEVHLIFDDPERNGLSPKFFERKHRDQHNPVLNEHYCSEFTSDMVIPLKWRENLLNCRDCKRNLICFLSNYFLEKMKKVLRPNQKFVTAGGFNDELRDEAMFVCMNMAPQSDNALLCNAEEADTRIWLHTINSAGQKKLVLSPDTDVYHIGLPIVAESDLDVLVRLNTFHSVEQRFLDMQALINAFAHDPELAHIPSSSLPSVMQALFVCTGCDFISFFNGLGKASFLATLFEYCKFICAASEYMPGTLADTNHQGKLSFFRLVGCAYFRKHRAVFLPAYPSPVTLYNSLKKQNQSPEDHHISWLDIMRERIWSRIKYEEDMIPSDGALARHWQRSCWVLSVWKQANCHHMTYPVLDGNGWKQPDPSTLVVDWDDDNHLRQVRTRVALIKKGCGCKTGCLSGRCKCQKANSHCGPGCKCQNCQNLPPEASSRASQMSSPEIPIDSDSDINSGDEDESDSDGRSDLDMEVDEIMNDVFGELEHSELDSEPEI